MKTYQTSAIRNVVLLGSTRCGKTTLADAMLYEGKVVDRKGTLDEGQTISATPYYTEFMDTKFNIIDTPGSDDFVGGAVAAFKVSETGILVVNAAQGVEVGTEIYERYAVDYKVPLILGINQLDSEKADWEETLAGLKKAFGNKPIVVQFPVNPGTGFDGFVDVLKMKYYHFVDDLGKREDLEIPENLRQVAEDLRQELIERAAENDDTLMETFFDKGELDEDEIRKGLGIGIRKGETYPIFCLSGAKSIGVKRLMEFTLRVAPAPSERIAITRDGKELECKAEGPTAIFIYKTAVEQHLGEVAYFKVMSGKVTEGMDLENAANQAKERIGSLYAVAGKQKNKITEMVAGDTGCTVKLKAAKTDITLVTPGAGLEVEHIKWPKYRFRCAIKAKDPHDEEKLGDALQKCAAEDPTIIVEYIKDLKQTILKGQGEQHINNLKNRLNNEFKVEVDITAPRISYRETITKIATANYRHKKQSGGAGQFGEVSILIAPYVEGEPEQNKFKIDGKDVTFNIKGKESFDLAWGGKLLFYNCVVGGAIDARFMPAILKGIMDKMNEGPLTGSLARDIKVYVYDGKMHTVDSNEISFILAARNAFKEAFRNAGPKIMEPIYDIEILTPEEYMGACMSDLQNRRAIIEGMGTERGFSVLKAKAPLAEMYRYSTTLSTLTSGSATFTMEYSGYQTVPGEIQEKLLKAYAESETEEE
ncbi:MAG: elongation factor G [Bacteroidales bacterium]|nr:elongation factor G [Bacteroidales bacterium]